MITPAHLFLLLLPGGVQETLPLPFLLRCHVSVPVGLHVVHPARSVCVCVCVRVSRSFKRQKLDVTQLCYNNARPVTTGEGFGETRQREKERKRRDKRERITAREPRTLLSSERPRETLDRRSICLYLLGVYVRSFVAVTVSRVPRRGKGFGIKKKRGKKRWEKRKGKKKPVKARRDLGD